MKKQATIHPAQACAVAVALVASTKSIIRAKVCTGHDGQPSILRVVYLDVVQRELDRLIESIVSEFAALHEDAEKPKPRRKARGEAK